MTREPLLFYKEGMKKNRIKMTMRSIQKRSIGIVILIFIILSTQTLSQSTVKESVSVELAIFNFISYRGSCSLDGDTQGDFPSINSFTMGIVNNGTQKISLEQVNFTFIMVGEGCKITQSTQVISNDSGIPIILYPRYYWLKDVTCDGENTTTSVQLKIKLNGAIINYGDVIFGATIKREYINYADWINKYRFYTERTRSLIPIDLGGILISLIALILWRRNKKKRESNEF
ncbi:MAG: hypothetical protein ACXACW_11020 [Candidatus Hodarchaeales archaeon]